MKLKAYLAPLFSETCSRLAPRQEFSKSETCFLQGHGVYPPKHIMPLAETEKALHALFKKHRSPAQAICHFPKPPRRHEVCGFSSYYKGALVRSITAKTY